MNANLLSKPGMENTIDKFYTKMQECADVIPAFLLHGEVFKIPCVIKTDRYDAHVYNALKRDFH